MTASTIDITTVVPVHNEEARLPLFFQGLPDLTGLEILLVLNGCQDRSEEVCQSFASFFSKTSIKLLRSPKGKGSAICHGLAQARSSSEMMGWTDADGSISWNSLLKLAELCKSNQKPAFGIRKRHQRSLFRQCVSRIGNSLMNLATGRQMPPDIGCPAKFFPREQVPHLTEPSWGIDMEAILKTSEFVTLEVDSRDVEGSHFGLRSAIENVRNAIRLIHKYRSE